MTKTFDEFINALKDIGFDGAYLANHGWDLKLKSNLWLSHPDAYKQTPYKMESFTNTISLVTTKTDRRGLCIKGFVDFTELEEWIPNYGAYRKELVEEVKKSVALNNAIVEKCKFKYEIPYDTVFNLLNLENILPESDCILPSEVEGLIKTCCIKIF